MKRRAPTKSFPGCEALRKRLGAKAYDRRIATEIEREEEFHAIISSKFTFFKLHLVRPLQRLALKCLGLYAKGRNELLSPVVVENEVHFGNKLPVEFDGFRIIHLSDLHIDIDDDLEEAIAQVLMSHNYDLCVMTGDFRNKTVGTYDKTVSLMLKLRKAVKTEAYLVLGNHDYLGMVPELEQGGYRFLLNESVGISRGESSIFLGGIDDPVIFHTDDIPGAFAGTPRTALKILLGHSPRVYRRAEASGVDFLLCGHTHGGQVCLPGGRALVGNDSSPKTFHKGSWRFGKLLGYTTVGAGASGLPIRLNCPPELVIHTLRR